jgi:hypothetical protein
MRNEGRDNKQSFLPTLLDRGGDDWRARFSTGVCVEDIGCHAGLVNREPGPFGYGVTATLSCTLTHAPKQLGQELYCTETSQALLHPPAWAPLSKHT